MRMKTTMNMTEGRPLALLSVFALPLLIGNLFQQAYNLADSMIVGRLLGADALAAVGATGSISFLFFSIFNGISGGCGIVTAQFFGAKKDEMVCRAIANSAYIMLASALLMPAPAVKYLIDLNSWMGSRCSLIIRTIHDLIRECNVSHEAALYRLKDLGYVQANEVRSFSPDSPLMVNNRDF